MRLEECGAGTIIECLMDELESEAQSGGSRATGEESEAVESILQ